MIIKKIKEIYKSNKISLILLIFIICILHIFITKTGDDLSFSEACNGTTLFDYISLRYQTWSSRIIIETLLVISCYLPTFIWKFANIGMFCLLIYSLHKLFIMENKRTLNCVLSICLICIPITILKEAGWIATMNNYLWVAATGLYAMIPLKKIYKNENINTLQIELYALSAIYACNQEQMAGILFLVYTFFLIDIIRKKKPNKLTILIIYAIIIISLIVILLCPGNENRKIIEEEHWYPTYSELSLGEKLSQGLTSMMNFAVDKGRILFLGLIILVSYTMWINENKKTYKFLGLIPLISFAGYKEVVKILTENGKTSFIENSNIFMIFQHIAYIVILLSIAWNIYQIFKKEEGIKKYIPLLIYSVGFVSRYIMAFSPTVYASGERTSFLWYLSMCILIVLIVRDKILNVKKGEKEEWVNLKE